MTSEADGQMSGTAEGMLAFLEWAGNKGIMGMSTSVAYRTAVTKVFEIDGDSWQSTPIKDLDVDLQLDRFARLRGSKYNPESLKTYGNRFRAAVSGYVKYLGDPTNFRTLTALPPKPKKIVAKGQVKQPEASAKSTHRSGPTESSTSGSTRHDEPDLVQYPFPLRSGVMAYLSLPRDLRKAEASRIAAFVASLAIDPVLELAAGELEK